MYRVVLPACVSLLLVGCGMAASPLPAGFADSGQPTSSISPRSSQRTASAGTPTPANSHRSRKLDDQARKGIFEKAPHGALADRNYSQTSLSADKARDLINAYRKSKGLKALKLDATLTEAAKSHSRDLA